MRYLGFFETCFLKITHDTLKITHDILKLRLLYNTLSLKTFTKKLIYKKIDSKAR